MSEYTSITTDMRMLMGCFTGFTEFERDKFERLCDAIDAIHANLERENESLRREQDCTHVELPKDADGEPVRIGDVLEWPDGSDEPFEVVGIGLNGTVYYMYDESCEWTNASTKRHHQPDTWERIIEDARTCTGSAGHYTSVPSMRWTSEVDALVARCRALAGE